MKTILKRLLFVPAWCLLALALPGLASSTWAAQAERVTFLNVEFVVYWVAPGMDELRLCWRDDEGKLLGTFSRMREHLAARSREVKFAINAGIFSRDGAPLGLHIEESKTLRPLNLGSLQDGQSNFYLKPNGVFYLVGNKPGIAESSTFAKLDLQPRLACQSGPLLIDHGKIHPSFQPDSKSYRTRSGVGISKDRKVVFALSKKALRFHDFARLFKEKLECEDALYLDGEICAIYLPELGYQAEDTKTSFAGMFAVTVSPAKRR